MGAVAANDAPAQAGSEETRARARKLLAPLETVCAMKECDPRGPFVLGLTYFKASNDKERGREYYAKAQEWFAKTLAGCRAWRNDRVHGLFQPLLTIGVAKLAAKQGWFTLLKDACDTYVQLSDDPASAQYADEEDRSPILLLAKELVGKPDDFYLLYEKVGGGMFGKADGLRTALKAKLNPEALRDSMLKRLGGKPTHVGYMRLAAFLQWLTQDGLFSARVLLAAREKLAGDPPDLRCEREMTAARLLVVAPQDDAASREEALKAAVEALKAAESLDGLQEEVAGLYAARLHLLMKKDVAAAESVMKRLLARGKATRHAYVAEVCAGAGMLGEALQRYDALHAGRPWDQLGKVHEALSNAAADDAAKKKHALAAVRYYNGAGRHSSDLPPWPPDETLDTVPVAGASQDRNQGMSLMIERLGGQAALVKAFLSGPLPALKPEGEKRAKDLFAMVIDEKLDDGKRQDALGKLKLMGPGAAPILKPLLQHAEAWISSDVQATFDKWALPMPE